MTPGQFLKQVEGLKWRREQKARDRIELAWLVAMLSRQKKVPSLDRLLRSHGIRAVKDPGQAKAEYEELKRRLGG